MILQALTSYYETLASQGKVPRSGWTKLKVSYALEIDKGGAPIAIYPLKTQESRNGKDIWVPREIELPAPVKRTVGIMANFLCDNAAYMLGLAKGSDTGRAKQCFESAAELHHRLLDNLDVSEAEAVTNFFDTYDTENPPKFINELADEFSAGGNIIFMYEGQYVHDNSEICAAWQNYYNMASDKDEMICLITGQRTAPMATHPAIKGVRNAQSAGAALVSFNAKAYESFGREQNLNAPVGKYASFAYTAALNYLIADREHNRIVGDSTVVYWAENADESYQDWYSSFIDGKSDKFSDEDIREAMKKLSAGLPVSFDEHVVDPADKFYILALAPNAARLSVRMFLCNSFGEIAKNISEHYRRLEIAGNSKIIPLWQILDETVLKVAGKSSSMPSPQMSGDTLRSILINGFYPATLYQQIQLRIRADRNINGRRAAIIKAYLLQNTNSNIYKEVITVELNEQTTYQPYVLGRLFAVLEMIQEKANPDIVTTIKDKYFTSASATPAAVFPTLMNLSEKHLRKLETGNKIYCQKMKAELTTLLTDSYPVHETLYDQGIFQLGYYHQRQKRFEKKDTCE